MSFKIGICIFDKDNSNCDKIDIDDEFTGISEKR